jgi:uncharacterized membrane protein
MSAAQDATCRAKHWRQPATVIGPRRGDARVDVTGEILSIGLVRTAWAIYALVLLAALRLLPWRRLTHGLPLHLLGGTVVCLMVLWSLRTEVHSGLEFHLLGMTTATLMLGWSTAVLAGSLALVGLALAGLADWGGLPVTALLIIVLPTTLTQVLLVLICAALPKHFFVYVFLNAFLTAGIVALASGYLAAAILVADGVRTLEELRQTFLPFFPLMFFPEAFVNGFVISVMVGMRPEWVASFNDDEYLRDR